MSEKPMDEVIDEFLKTIQSEVPSPTHEFGHYEDVQVEMRDGVKLMTRILFPDGEGPWPVILIRMPYLPVNSNNFMQGPWAVFTRYGYAVVYQQTRGIYDSEGEWYPFENERNDGLDVVEWIINQKWMNGNMGTFGGSYLGHVQWCMADLLPPEVKTMYFSVFSGRPYELFYRNGMFRNGIFTHWASSMMEPDKLKTSTPVDLVEIYKSIEFVRPPIEMDRQLTGRRHEWYRNWIMNPGSGSDYWTKGFWQTFKGVSERVNIPIFFQGGWFDIFIDGMLETFQDLSPKTRKESRFVINPWNHSLQTSGDLEYPNHKRNTGTMLIQSALEWFGHHLKGESYPHPKGVIETYVIREGVWKTWEEKITPLDTRRFFLKNSNVGTCLSGAVVDLPMEKQETVSFQYDPSSPVPTMGGTILVNFDNPLELPDTSVRQDEPGSREDVISFISETMKEDLCIAGEIKVHMYVSSDAEDTAFTVKVSEVFPDGKAYNIRDDITTIAFRNKAPQPLTYKPGEIINLEMNLPAIMWNVKKGSRIRLDVSSSNYPMYHIHPNVAGIWSLQTNVKIANQTIHAGGSLQSYIDIPFMK
jgi:putative CocE/NonD family hydrolase